MSADTEVAESNVERPEVSGSRTSQLPAPDHTTRVSIVQRVRHGLGVVTGAGWATLAIAVASWVVGWRLGWNEFMVIATAAAACLTIAVAFIFGATTLSVEVEVSPQRVSVGGRSAGQMTVTNPRAVRSLPSRMELIVGSGAAEFDIPSLGAGGQHDELFILPTERRGIIPVGPATSVRGDPMGLLRRSVPWTTPVPLFVHPRVTPLGHLGAGFLRDLEGQPTPDLSPSDIAFHALREYQAGDDRRFVHWMTSARVGKLMVRQFTDTRRAHLAVVVDGARSAYADSTADNCEEFELALSIAGSLGVRAIYDEQDVSMMVAGHDVVCTRAVTLLDGLAAASLGGRRSSLVRHVEIFTRSTSGVSLAVIVSGSRATIADLRAAAMRFPEDVRTLIVRVDPGGESGLRPLGNSIVLSVSSLNELARLMLAVTQS